MADEEFYAYRLRVLLIRKDFKHGKIFMEQVLGLRVLLIRKDFKLKMVGYCIKHGLRVLLIRKDFKRCTGWNRKVCAFESLVNTEGF